ncbi:hypothetical protein C0J08_18370 [Marinomonas sp. CT5]|uniref:outer membrane beta-barrel protein n=1 Tax=Marinomonas sp. CT5 TaxID=2066133 RepID=UPI001BB0C332|nr:outer membrane beta-barrel protein [Marinomonas sp. CT5]QUX97233.1 hypothetical protein C0J08_18370 [Marinomonas sp. CT5]
MKFTKMALAASLIAGASFANAGDIKYGLQIGHAKGGDNFSTEPSFQSSSDVGDGDFIGAFTIIPVSANELSIKIAASYLSKEGSYPNNAKVKFTRLPIDVLLLKQIDKLQLGAGLTYHLSSKAEFTDTNGEITTTDTKNAFGIALEANYQVFSNDSLAVDLGVRYTNIEYKFKDKDSTKRDGSNFAITAGITF